jgi:DNA-directed RNA polymerase specialized sigma24 family protein
LADTLEPFDALLAWLDPDRVVAAQKYETIRAGLVRIFVARGFSNAEDMADDTIDRVIKKLSEIRDGYVGEPARYFHGVARNVIREAYRLKEIATDVSPVASIQVTNRSDRYECLLRCLKFLPPEKRDMALDYHVYEGHDKVEQHKTMAQELGISENALRGRVHHIRNELEKCVLQCMETLRKQTKPVPGSIVDSGAGTRSVSHGPGRRA